MNNVFNNLTNSLSREFEKFALDDVVRLSLSKLPEYDLQINNFLDVTSSELFDQDIIANKIEINIQENIISINIF